LILSLSKPPHKPTALRVLTDWAPDFVPVAVPHAMALIDGRALRAG